MIPSSLNVERTELVGISRPRDFERFSARSQYDFLLNAISFIIIDKDIATWSISLQQPKHSSVVILKEISRKQVFYQNKPIFREESVNNSSSKIEKMERIWEKNRQYFQDHEKELKQQHPGLYVAVHDGKVIGTGDQIGPLAGRLYDELGVPFYAAIPGKKEILQIDWPLEG